MIRSRHSVRHNREVLMNPDPPAPPEPRAAPTPRDTLRARFMFVLAFVHLLLVAGLVHRATSKTVSRIEIDVLYAGLLALWPVFAVEAIWGVYRRDRTARRKPIVLRAALVTLMPPWRMALADT